MKTQGQAAFISSDWDKKPYQELDNGAKLTRIHLVQTYTGDMQGKGISEALMAYNGDRTASGVGLEHMVGSIGGKTGTFIVQHTSTFAYPVAKDSWFVVPGTATGELRGLRAEGVAIMEGQKESYTTDFTYFFVDEPVAAKNSDTNA
jgi:hypothetical protein